MWRFARVVLLSATAGVFSLPALAADLPPQTEPIAPVAFVPAFSWTGFYLGGAIGWLGTNSEYTAAAGVPFVVTSDRIGARAAPGQADVPNQPAEPGVAARCTPAVLTRCPFPPVSATTHPSVFQE